VCARNDWIVVSDTSWTGYQRIPLMVMQGYTVAAGEALDVLDQPPTHVFLQAGVGGFAAAVAMYLTDRLVGAAPRIIVVEPERAACVMAGARAGKPVRVTHGEPTLMSMLECYQASTVALRILQHLADAFLAVPDEWAVMAMRKLAYPTPGDPAMIAGESGAAGLAGLLAAATEPTCRAALALDQTSRILVFNTEGSTDPVLYRRLVGLAAPLTPQGLS
jgi:diaminopropionate ammonia-lyase